MKKIYALLFPFLLPLASFAQEAKQHSCSRVKSNHAQLKSATLSVGQIAETEKYDVHFYFLDLNMTNTSTYLSGTTEIHAMARENLDSALVELYKNFTINAVMVDGAPVSYRRSGSIIKIPVNAVTGSSFVLSVNYEGAPPTAASNPLGGGGMNRSTSMNVTWSLSEPFSAYEWFPVKQSLKDRADSCAVYVTVPSACKAGSNGILKNVVNLGNGKHRYEWKHLHSIDYYLISVAVGEYLEYNLTAYPSNSPPVFIQNYVYNQLYLDYYKEDIDETADFIELYADLYGPYPYADEKYGHCMAPVGGGMEHQTMTTQDQFIKGLTSHELAHQWFGDHVTCASWSDIWVNEGFARYSEYIMLENLYPAEKAAEMTKYHSNVLSAAGGSVWVEDSLNSDRIFDGRLTYDKGAAILHTMRFLVHDDAAYFNAYRTYQEDFADSTALGVDFKAVMEDATGADLTPFFEEWYFGEGYPTYSASWNAVGNELYLEINQTASKPGVTPFFTNDLEIKFARTGMADTVIRFTVLGPHNEYFILNAGPVSNLKAIDPANWIINRTGSIVRDATMVGIDEQSAASERMSIYPNPSNGPFTVEMAVPGAYELTIVDPKGRVIHTKSFQQQSVIDLGNAATGAYLIQVSSPDGTKVRRIIKH